MEALFPIVTITSASVFSATGEVVDVAQLIVVILRALMTQSRPPMVTDTLSLLLVALNPLPLMTTLVLPALLPLDGEILSACRHPVTVVKPG